MELQRYTWEDALTEYVTLGIITQAQYGAACRLSHVVTWQPKRGKPSGLYWDDELAASAVGLSRTTFYDRRKELVSAGFFKRVNGNLIPTLPDNYDAVHETFEARKAALTTEHVNRKSENPDSQSENSDYQSEHSDSQSENSDQYSVDTYTVDESSEDSVSDTAPVVADAPTVPVQQASSLPKGDGEDTQPVWGGIWVSETGDVLFEADTGSGSYILSESGVSSLSLPETRTAAPVDLDPIPADAATPSPLERELAECRRRWALSGETGWKATEARIAEETAIRECHGVTADAW